MIRNLQKCFNQYLFYYTIKLSSVLEKLVIIGELDMFISVRWLKHFCGRFTIGIQKIFFF